MSNRTDPAFLARFEPHRYAIRPAECDMGDGHTCWVTQPYDAITQNQRKPRCTGCGGLIAPVDRRRLSGFWPEAQAAILSALERGET